MAVTEPLKWMSYLPDEALLKDVILPGRHDAGVFTCQQVSTRLATKSLTICQNTNFGGQSAAGSRMFDCRVFLKRDGAKLVPTFGHFAVEKGFGIIPGRRGETGRLGAYGGSLLTAISDAVSFVAKYSTEFIILRISHTYKSEVVAEDLKQFLNLIGRNEILCVPGNIANMKISQLRGKVILVFASEFYNHFDHKNGFHPFYKHNGNKRHDGLCTCGKYDGDKKIGDVFKTASKGFEQHMGHESDHLHFVYWQQTGGEVQKNTLSPKSVGKTKAFSSGGSHSNLGDFIQVIRQNVIDGKWKIPNVISHDFVKEETCKEIWNLNFPRPEKVWRSGMIAEDLNL